MGMAISCEHKQSFCVTQPGGHGHKLCDNCGRRLAVIPASEVKPQRLPDFDLIFLLRTGELSDWEEGFLASYRREKQPSAKQRECFHRIVRKYFPGALV